MGVDRVELDAQLLLLGLEAEAELALALLADEDAQDAVLQVDVAPAQLAQRHRRLGVARLQPRQLLGHRVQRRLVQPRVLFQLPLKKNTNQTIEHWISRCNHRFHGFYLVCSWLY